MGAVEHGGGLPANEVIHRRAPAGRRGMMRMACAIAQTCAGRSGAVVPVVVELPGRAEQEHHAKLVAAPNRVDGRDPPGLGVAEHAPLDSKVIRHAEHGEVAAKKVQELVLVAEREPTRVIECRPSAPTTRSKVLVADRSKLTST